MKIFLSVMFGLFGLSLILFFIMGGVFYSAALQNQPDDMAASETLQTSVVWFFMLMPIVLFGLHVYGQKLFWSNDHKGLFLPLLSMFSGLPAIALMIGLVFMTLG